MAQTITKKHGEDIIIVDEEGTIPPPTGDCQCDVQIGTVETISPGSPATATMEEVDGVHLLSLGIPKGDKGDPGEGGGGTPPPVNTGILGVGNAHVNDHLQSADNGDWAKAFTRAWNQVRATGGTLWYDNIPYNFKSTFLAEPQSNGGYVSVNIRGTGQELHNGQNRINYTGPSGQPVIRSISLKDCSWEDIKINIAGQTNVPAIAIYTALGAESYTGVCFKNIVIYLGNGANQGFKIEKGTPQHQNHDVSLCEFFSCKIYGVQKNPTPGSFAYLNQDPNCLAMHVWGGFVQGCDGIYSNWPMDGTDASRGGATWSFYGVETSGNNCNYWCDREGSLLVDGGRYEHDRMIFKTRGGNHPINASFLNLRADAMTGMTMFDINQACTLEINNCQTHRSNPNSFNELVLLRGGGNASTVNITGGATRANEIVRRSGGAANCKVYVRGLQKLVDGPFLNGVEGHYPDISRSDGNLM